MLPYHQGISFRELNENMKYVLEFVTLPGLPIPNTYHDRADHCRWKCFEFLFLNSIEYSIEMSHYQPIELQLGRCNCSVFVSISLLCNFPSN